MDEFYTTNQLAKLFGVGPTTVITWVEHGELEAWKTLGGHRRIRHQAVLDFLHRHRLPYPPAFADNTIKIVVLAAAPAVLTQIGAVLQRDQPRTQLHLETDPTAALLRIGAERPRLVVLDSDLPGLDAAGFCRGLRASAALESLRILAIGIGGNAAPELLSAGADAFLETWLLPAQLAETAHRLLGQRPAESRT
jgi:excisionase family DNA binding protein